MPYLIIILIIIFKTFSKNNIFLVNKGDNLLFPISREIYEINFLVINSPQSHTKKNKHA
jgi:hypothetical protein